MLPAGTSTLRHSREASVTTALASLKYTSIKDGSAGKLSPYRLTVSPKVPARGSIQSNTGLMISKPRLLTEGAPFMTTVTLEEVCGVKGTITLISSIVEDNTTAL